MSGCYITNYQCISPMGFTHADLRENLLSAKLCISSLPENFLPLNVPVKFVGRIPNQVISLKTSFKLDEEVVQQRKLWLDHLFAETSQLEESDKFCSIIFVHNMGANISNYFHWLESKRLTMWSDDSQLPLSQFAVLKRIPKSSESNVIAFHNTCASVNSAIAYGAKRIRAGIDKKIMVVAIETSNNYWPAYVTLSSLGVLNTTAQKIEDAIQPFSSTRAGFVKADALGFLVLESEESVTKSKKVPYCEVVGQGMTSDSNSLTDGVEDGSIVAKTMMAAINDAKIDSDQVDYINAHGTGTFLNDLIEVRAIKTTFGERAKEVPISSNKSQYGHALCASGLVEISSVLEMFKNNFLAANLNCDRLDPECNLNFVKDPIKNANLKYVVKNSFGFGGYNASLVLKNCC